MALLRADSVRHKNVFSRGCDMAAGKGDGGLMLGPSRGLGASLPGGQMLGALRGLHHAATLSFQDVVGVTPEFS